MSYDFYTLKVCSHRVVDEVCILDSDTGTMIGFAKPPSSGDVSLKINGVQIPKNGLYSDSEFRFSKRGPYKIISNKNDMIIFRDGVNPPINIKLPPGSAVSAKTLARYLLDYIPNYDIYDDNGYVVFKALNGTSFCFVDPRWVDKTSSLTQTTRIINAYSTLGIPPGRVSTTRKLFPGYRVMLNPAAFVDEWIIKFNGPIPNSSPVITVSYTTLAAFCSRCIGSRVEYDYTTLNGSYDVVRNADLLIQEFDKFLFTIKGSHWKWPWLGSGILNRIGGKASTAFGLASSFISLDINSAFNTYQNIKRQQDKNFPGQNVSDAEYPYSLGTFNVTTGDDPTTFYAEVEIVNKSRDSAQLTKQLSLPDPYQLTSSPSGVMKNAGNGFQLRG